MALSLALLLVGQVAFGEPLVYRIDFPGTVQQVQYVRARFPDGRITEVPIVNGFSPEVTIYHCNGTEIRHCKYTGKNVWRGELINYWNLSDLLAQKSDLLAQKSVQVEEASRMQMQFEQMRKQVEMLQQQVQSLSKNPPQTMPGQDEKSIPKRQPVSPVPSIVPAPSIAPTIDSDLKQSLDQLDVPSPRSKN